MKEKIEITIQEVNEALRVLEELPIKYTGIAQYVVKYFTDKFKETNDNGDNNNLDSTLSTQDSCESGL